MVTHHTPTNTLSTNNIHRQSMCWYWYGGAGVAVTNNHLAIEWAPGMYVPCTIATNKHMCVVSNGAHRMLHTSWNNNSNKQTTTANSNKKNKKVDNISLDGKQQSMKQQQQGKLIRSWDGNNGKQHRTWNNDRAWYNIKLTNTKQQLILDQQHQADWNAPILSQQQETAAAEDRKVYNITWYNITRNNRSHGRVIKRIHIMHPPKSRTTVPEHWKAASNISWWYNRKSTSMKQQHPNTKQTKKADKSLLLY